jgi:UDP-glucose 4-epimerase
LGFETKKIPQIINFSSGVQTSVGELIEIIMKTFKINKKVVVMEGTKGDQFGIVGSTKLMQDHDIQMNTDLETGIKLTYEYIMSSRIYE